MGGDPPTQYCVGAAAAVAGIVYLVNLVFPGVVQALKTSFVGELLGVASHDAEGTRRAVAGQKPWQPPVFYRMVMKQKELDHGASHSNCVNQFMHFISSLVFIYNFYTFYVGDYTTTVITGLLSLTLRQSGHAIFEPPCHTAESLCLGFDTRAKCMVFSTYAITVILATLYFMSGSEGSSFEPGAKACVVVTVFFVFGHAWMISLLHGISIGLVWFTKFATDPFTDLKAYYKSCVNVWTSPDWQTATWRNFTAHLKSAPEWHLKSA